jgi:hypothetical protein
MMNEHDVKRLQAHEYHNVEAIPSETPQIVYEGRELYFEGGYEDRIVLHVSNSKVYIEMPWGRGIEVEDNHFDDLIALLQRAQTIIKGGA